MSKNKYFDQYLELYSQWVDARINLHNSHIRFCNYMGIDSLTELRRYLKALPRIEKEMGKVAKLARIEQRAILKAERITGQKQARPKKKIIQDAV